MRYTFILLFFIKQCLSQEFLINELVKNITNLEEEAKNSKEFKNSNSYLGDKTSIPKDAINDGDYDFIICGAGSAGTVLTNRLSEIGKWKILLLEAGTWETDTTDIPNVADYLRVTDYNWGYHVEPQKNVAQGYIDNAIFSPRGKGIGGSSIINAMIYARGNRADFDLWGSNNPGWSYEDVLPCFKKSEKVSFPNANKNYHGTNGTVHIEYSRIVDEVGKAFLKAQTELGRNLLDYNAANQMGFSIVQLNEIKGRRDSGGKAFISEDIKKRKNLRIVTEALIVKVLIKHKKAHGVQYLKDGNLFEVKAKKEVLLSMGSINTAQILMLSGIGPEDHLNSLKIPCEMNLPVGNNLWDHPIFDSLAFSMNYTYNYPNTSEQVTEYLNGKGPLTTSDFLQCIGYVNVNNESETVPDVEHVFHASKPGSQGYKISRNLNRFTLDAYKGTIKPTEGINQWTIHSLLLHPKSRGTVRLKSSNPLDFPLIDPQYFTHPKDVETLVKAIKDIFRIHQTPAMKTYNSTVIKTCLPICNCSDWGSDNFWACMVKNLATSVYHFSGTTKMGPIFDDTSVVDHRLKVYGINKLRVVDCSVIPDTTSGHTNAVAFMIGEKASDLIKEEYLENDDSHSGSKEEH